MRGETSEKRPLGYRFWVSVRGFNEKGLAMFRPRQSPPPFLPFLSLRRAIGQIHLTLKSN